MENLERENDLELIKVQIISLKEGQETRKLQLNNLYSHMEEGIVNFLNPFLILFKRLKSDISLILRKSIWHRHLVKTVRC